MRARLSLADTASIALQLEAAFGFDRLKALDDGFAQATPDTVGTIIDQAAKFAADYLGPLNDDADRLGCKIKGGRVVTPPGFNAAYDAYVSAGWPLLEHPAPLGGQGLPRSLSCAVQELLDREFPGFSMIPVPTRAAARMIAAYGDDALKAEWLPHLVAGDWVATICISEPGAGSDVGRIATRATQSADGRWSVTGEKMWISFGDHDLTPRIGHCVLARTPEAPQGAAGLSLFFVEGGGADNGVSVRRIEEKLGLHGSPTCALGFENAKAHLVGSIGRGLTQLFVMIVNMRLAVGVQGLGVASGASDLAFRYAQERRQGGSPTEPATPIVKHADVQRQLLEQIARVEMLRGLVYTTANLLDLSIHESEASARKDAADLAGWFLPLVKTLGGEYAFDVASISIQVLGGAGYTRDWPAEQMLRDARVFTVFEGTTGMQGADLVHRRLRGCKGRGLALFLSLARADLTGARSPAVDAAKQVFDLLERAGALLLGADVAACDAAATAFLDLAALAATAWIAVRLISQEGASPAHMRINGAAEFWIQDLPARAALSFCQIQSAPKRVDIFATMDCPPC